MAQFNFEKAMNELQELIDKMETDEPSLDESIAHFERGSLLIRQCSKKLSETEKKIQILLKDDNEQVIKNFENNNETKIKSTITEEQQPLDEESSLF